MQTQLNKHIILERLTQIKPHLHQQFTVMQLALFGSYARDEQTVASDIDILIRLQDVTYKNLCGTAYALYDLFPEAKVEVVSEGAIKPNYLAYVKPDLLYA